MQNRSQNAPTRSDYQLSNRIHDRWFDVEPIIFFCFAHIDQHILRGRLTKLFDPNKARKTSAEIPKT